MLLIVKELSGFELDKRFSWFFGSFFLRADVAQRGYRLTPLLDRNGLILIPAKDPNGQLPDSQRQCGKM